MSEVKVIKANRDRQIEAGRAVDKIRVAAYCRVSTDDEDQMNSYHSQVKYYTEMIVKNPNWQMADVYADAAVTGTKADKREGFMKMIADCQDGKIDQVITKSISRFARNTVDTLKYVRMLKEKNVAVIFEEEKINTMTMDGELLLTVLSSVAQQEVENISANVKKGLKMKMQRGELIGFNGCYGYDYNKEDKTISVNENERQHIQFIFDKYVQGYGCRSIARELKAKGVLKRDGTTDWKESGIRGIIDNVKYKGDIIMGATFTADPISKRRLKNYGEEDMYYVENHHEPIIDRELFDLAQEIKEYRAGKRENGRHQIAYKQYAFSGVLRCGCCGAKYARKTIHGNREEYKRIVWQCLRYVREGKKSCPKCKTIREEILEGAFVECYKLLCERNESLVEKAVDEAFDMLGTDDITARMDELKKKLAHHKQRRESLLDRMINEVVSSETFERKMSLIEADISNLNTRIRYLEDESKARESRRKHLKSLKNELKNGDVITAFNRNVFESIIQDVIIGGYDENGEYKPHNLTFVLKTEDQFNMDGREFIPQRKNAAASLRYNENTYEIRELFHFTYFGDYFKFDKDEWGMKKVLLDSVKVFVSIPVYAGNESEEQKQTA